MLWIHLRGCLSGSDPLLCVRGSNLKMVVQELVDLAGLLNSYMFICLQRRCAAVIWKEDVCVCVPFSQHEQRLRRLIHETTTL